MKRSKNSGLGVGKILLSIVLFAVGSFIGRAVVMGFFDASGQHPFPTSTSAAAIVTDDPAIHKFFKKQLAATSFAGSYEVAYPSKLDFRVSVHVASTDIQTTANRMGAVMGATWAYLHKNHADPKTRITMTVTDGYRNVYDLTAFGLEAKPTFKDFEALVKEVTSLAR